MKKLIVLAGMALGLASLSGQASARNYDCTKAGNANKAACKSPGAATVASHKTTKVTTTKTTARTYDCTKAGNANKSACKAAAPASVPVARKVTQTTTASLDCTKFYNKMRAACRTPGAITKTSTTTTVAAAPTSVNKPVATHGRATTTVTRSVNSDATGATAQCKDGSYSHAQHHSGACSRHGGVAKWMS